jgi:hypothetical protein
MMISVQNRLKAASTVPTTVDVLMFVRFDNVRVYEMSPVPLCHFGEGPSVELASTARSAASPVTKTSDENFQAEGSEAAVETILESPPTHGDEPPTESVPNTAEQSHVMKDEVCRLDLGRKFEYCITDVHEVLRRHVAITDFPIITLGVANYRSVTVEVRPRHPFMQFFAGWAGHMKYRMFTNIVTSLCTPRLVTQLPELDPLVINNGYLNFFTQPVKSSWSPTTTIRKTDIPLSLPVEVMYPLSSNWNYIDVSVPFNTNLNFLLTNNTYFGDIPTSVGYVIFQYNTSTPTDIDQYNTIYEAVGDDFRALLYRPPLVCLIQPIANTSSTRVPTGHSISGYFF